jgi:hypothetical protein
MELSISMSYPISSRCMQLSCCGEPSSGIIVSTFLKLRLYGTSKMWNPFQPHKTLYRQIVGQKEFSEHDSET